MNGRWCDESAKDSNGNETLTRSSVIGPPDRDWAQGRGGEHRPGERKAGVSRTLMPMNPMMLYARISRARREEAQSCEVSSPRRQRSPASKDIATYLIASSPALCHSPLLQGDAISDDTVLNFLTL